MAGMQFMVMAGTIMVPMILLASWIDYRQHRVPNWLNLALATAGVTGQVSFYGWDGLTAGLTGGLLGLGLLIVPWLMHLMGAGDVKLLAAIGTWLGPALVLWAFVFGAIIGGVVALVMIIGAGRIRPALANLSSLVAKCSNRRLVFSDMGSVKKLGTQAQLLPYGVPLTLGTLVILGLKVGGWW